MKVLVMGGTRFFGVHLVRELLKKGYAITLATRGNVKDPFGNSVHRIKVDRSSQESVAEALGGLAFDVVCDNIAYCSNDVKYLLDAVSCRRYVLTSTGSVYDLHGNIYESEFNPLEKTLEWCDSAAYHYGIVKQLAECALFQAYGTQSAVAVRFPFVIGEDDYTNRMYFYVEHIVKGLPMFINNPHAELGFIRSDEAGRFLTFMSEHTFNGPVNASSKGTLSVNTLIRYVEEKTGLKALLSDKGDPAPYNGAPDFSLNTVIGEGLGFEFTSLDQWVYTLLDTYIERAQK